MSEEKELQRIMRNRCQLYLLLSRIFRVEVDQDLLNKMKGMNFPEAEEEAELARGYQKLSSYLAQPGDDPLTTLAVDYARTFLGAGIAQGTVAYPYESVYTSPEHLMLQEARDQVLDLYRAKGLCRSETLDMPEDHIAFELEFMAHLCEDALGLSKKQDEAAVVRSLGEQKQFLNDHLLNWVPKFCADIHKCAETAFYKAAADILLGLLRLESAMVEELVAEPASTVA